jgi:hypothetical protein
MGVLSAASSSRPRRQRRREQVTRSFTASFRIAPAPVARPLGLGVSGGAFARVRKQAAFAIRAALGAVALACLLVLPIAGSAQAGLVHRLQGSFASEGLGKGVFEDAEAVAVDQSSGDVFV